MPTIKPAQSAGFIFAYRFDTTEQLGHGLRQRNDEDV